MDQSRPRRPRLKLDAELYNELRNHVLVRDGWRCQSCGSTKNLQVHHLRPRSKLGDDSMNNLLTLCVTCHAQQHRNLSSH